MLSDLYERLPNDELFQEVSKNMNSRVEKEKFETMLIFNRGERLIEPVIIKEPNNLKRGRFTPILQVFRYKTPSDLKPQLYENRSLTVNIFSDRKKFRN